MPFALQLMAKSNLKEKILYSQIQRKDRDAFVKAYDLYVKQIYRFIFFKVNSREEAEDLTSLVFLKSWDHVQNKNLADFKTLKALLYKVARNTVIDHYRKSSQKFNVEIGNESDALELADESQNPHKEIEAADEFSALAKKILGLKDEYREVITLRYIDELSIKEIADIINKSRGNTRVLIYRALNALRELVDS